MVAPAARAALTSVALTQAMLSRRSVSHSYRSSTTCEPNIGGRHAASPASAPIVKRFSLLISRSLLQCPLPVSMLPSLLSFLLLFLLAARRSSRLHAFDRSRLRSQTLVGQFLQHRESGAQQLTFLDRYAEADAALLEQADALVIGHRHGEAVANDLAMPVRQLLHSFRAETCAPVSRRNHADRVPKVFEDKDCIRYILFCKVTADSATSCP